LALGALPPGASLGAAGSQPFGAFIVQGATADQAAALVARLGGSVTSRLDLIRGVGALCSPRPASR
jgi:hypothetical protein